MKASLNELDKELEAVYLDTSQGGFVGKVRLTPKSKQQILSWVENEVIESNAQHIATDDLLTDYKVSFAIQERLKDSMRRKLK